MPFIEPKNRDRIKLLGCEACTDVGDICFVFYTHLTDAWKHEPRWRTAHRLYRDLVIQPEGCDYFNYVYDRLQHRFELSDCVAACQLAWQVFFENYVMPYEKLKEEQNGTI